MTLTNLGRPLMLCVQASLLLDILQPFLHPLNIFTSVTLIFMVLIHDMQLAPLKNAVPKDGPQMTNGEKIHAFLLGVFELLVWQKKIKGQLKRQL